MDELCAHEIVLSSPSFLLTSAKSALLCTKNAAIGSMEDS